MKKIQIYVEDIKGYEADKQVILLSNSLSNYFDITIVAIGKIRNEIALNKKVKLVEFNVNNFNNYLTRLKLRNNITKFMKDNESDIIVSTSLEINKLLSSLILKGEVIYWRLDEGNIDNKTIHKTFKYINRIVFTSEEEKERYSFLGIDSIVISPAIMSVPLDFEYVDNKNMLYIGNLNDANELKKLIDILIQVLDYDSDIKLYIIGDGKERIELVNYCKGKKVQDNVIFYGSLDSNEIDYELKRMSLYINFENSVIGKIKLIEAMNYGIPTISYNHETLKNIIENDINGYLINEDDDEELKNKILQVFSSKDNLLNMRQCARETSMFYEINSIKSEWLKIL